MQILTLLLIGLSAPTHADLNACRAAVAKEPRRCYDLVTSTRTAVGQSNAIAQNAVEQDPNMGPRALGRTMAGAGNDGLRAWQFTKDKCEEYKTRCQDVCEIPDNGASALKKKCEDEIERYATIIDSGLRASSQALTAGINTSTSSYDQASYQQAGKFNDQVVDRKADLTAEGQAAVTEVKDHTLVGRDARGVPVAEESYVLPNQVERVKKIMMQSDGRICSVDVYTNQYVCE